MVSKQVWRGEFFPNDWSVVWKSNNNIKLNHFPIEVEYDVNVSGCQRLFMRFRFRSGYVL